MIENTNTDWNLLAKYFSNETTEAEMNKINSLLENNEEFRQLYTEVANIYGDFFSKTANTVIPSKIQAWEKVKAKTMLPKKYAMGKKWYYVAATVLFILGIGFFSYQLRYKSPAVFLIATNTMEATEPLQVDLPDGSVAYLNANTSLQYPEEFNGENRNVILSGEAFFEIKTDSLRPFIITANITKIKVLGTSFNVMAYPGNSQIEVMVSTGKVQFYTKEVPDKSILLMAGTSGVLIKSTQQMAISNTPDMNHLAWRTKQLIFSNTPLPHVVDILNKTYHKSIILPDNKFDSCKFTGKFQNQSLSSVIEVLKIAFSLEADTTNNSITFKGNGCNNH